MIKTKQWSVGDGSATIQYDGQGDGQITITSDPNNVYEARSMQITVETTDGSGLSRTVTINQAAKQRIDISNAVVTASNQTYSGSAKTPTPTVTLNGSTVPSSGYDVAYSNNTNAGTATITITGKGDYTGTAYGTFAINKASRTISWSSYPSSLYVGSTGTLSATASAGSSDGTISYSSSNSSKASVSGSTVTAVASGTCTIYASISEGTNYLSASTSYTLSVVALPYVDLGLPSGIKWAKSNLQKTSDSTAALCPNETDYGDFWSWANVGLTTSTGWMWSAGSPMTQTMYNSTTGKNWTWNIPATSASYNVAYKYLGAPWRLPTKTEFQELIDNTDRQWTTINNVNGWKFMKKTDHSVYVFFPASGLCSANAFSGRGSYGYYWSSTYIYDSSYSEAYSMYISSSVVRTSKDYRYKGISIRPVQ